MNAARVAVELWRKVALRDFFHRLVQRNDRAGDHFTDEDQRDNARDTPRDNSIPIDREFDAVSKNIGKERVQKTRKQNGTDQDQRADPKEIVAQGDRPFFVFPTAKQAGKKGGNADSQRFHVVFVTL